MPPGHPALSERDVLAHGGWHPRYARALAVASDNGYGLAVVDGNGDGTELEAGAWVWENGTWAAAASSGAGPLDDLGRVQTGGQIGDAYFAYGRAPGRPSVTIEFDGHLYQVPSAATEPGRSSRSAPTPTDTAFPPQRPDKKRRTLPSRADLRAGADTR